MVRGKPSKRYPCAQSDRLRRSLTRPTMMPSETSAPESMTFFAASPSGVPAFTAARSMSPVEICGIEYESRMKQACVPLPAPGGPSRINRMFDLVLVVVEFSRQCEARSNLARGVERAHALQILCGIHAGRRRARSDLHRDAIAVPQRAQLL